MGLPPPPGTWQPHSPPPHLPQSTPTHPTRWESGPVDIFPHLYLEPSTPYPTSHTPHPAAFGTAGPAAAEAAAAVVRGERAKEKRRAADVLGGDDGARPACCGDGEGGRGRRGGLRLCGRAGIVFACRYLLLLSTQGSRALRWLPCRGCGCCAAAAECCAWCACCRPCAMREPAVPLALPPSCRLPHPACLPRLPRRAPFFHLPPPTHASPPHRHIQQAPVTGASPLPSSVSPPAASRVACQCPQPSHTRPPPPHHHHHHTHTHHHRCPALCRRLRRVLPLLLRLRGHRGGLG